MTVDEVGDATVSLAVDSALDPGTHIVTVASPAGAVVATAELTVVAASDPGDGSTDGSGGADGSGGDRDDDGSLAVTGAALPAGWVFAGAALLLRRRQLR